MFGFIKKVKTNCGFTYVELIVVLGIFSMVTSVAMFDYGKFQSKVDIKNLANDIALRFVEAQRNALAGKWNSSAGANWKPSYGLYFSATTPSSFISFVDLNQDKNYTNGEVIETFAITKGNTISEIRAYNLSGTSTLVSTNAHITFTRPDSGAKICFNGSCPVTPISYLQIKVLSPRGNVTSCVKLYSSGRIQINSCS